MQPLPANRARIEALACALIDWLDAQDAALADMEPDHDGEKEAEEASAQPQPQPLTVVRFPQPLRMVPVTWGPR